MIYAVYLLAIGILGAVFFQVKDWVFGIKAGMTSKDLEKIAGVLARQSGTIAVDEEKADASYKVYEELKKSNVSNVGPANSSSGSSDSKS